MKMNGLIGMMFLLAPCCFAAATDTPCNLTVPVTEQPHLNQSQQRSNWFYLQQELLELLGQSAGCTIQAVNVPWSRSLLMLEEGQLDLVMTLSKNAERERYADFIGSHYVEEMILVLRNEYSTQLKNLADLTLLPGQVAVLRDGFYGDSYQQLQQQREFAAKLQMANTISHQLALLEHGRVIGMIGERTQYEQWAKVHPELARQYSEQLIVHRNPVYFAASRKALNQQQRDHLRASWAKVYGSPAHKAILAKYGWSAQLD